MNAPSTHRTASQRPFVEDQRDTRVSAVGSPHRESPELIFRVKVLRDTGEIRARFKTRLPFVELMLKPATKSWRHTFDRLPKFDAKIAVVS